MRFAKGSKRPVTNLWHPFGANESPSFNSFQSCLSQPVNEFDFDCNIDQFALIL